MNNVIQKNFNSSLNMNKIFVTINKLTPLFILFASTLLVHFSYTTGKLLGIAINSRLDIGFYNFSVSVKSLFMNGLYFVVLLPCVLWIEIAYAGYKDSSLYKLLVKPNRSNFIDLLMFIFYVIRFSKILTLLFTVGFIYFFEKYLSQVYDKENNFFNHFIGENSPIIAIFAYLLVWWFFDYCNHWLLHTKILWPIHRLHHSADNMTVLTAFRTHPTTAIIDPFTKTIPMLLLGVPADMVVVCVYVNSVYQLLAHSNIKSDWGWFGRWVILSPMHHRLHHSVNYNEYGKNIGVVAIWDHLFGTYMEPPKEEIILGNKLRRYRESNIIKILWVDFIDSLVVIRKSFFKYLKPARI